MNFLVNIRNFTVKLTKVLQKILITIFLTLTYFIIFGFTVIFMFIFKYQFLKGKSKDKRSFWNKTKSYDPTFTDCLSQS